VEIFSRANCWVPIRMPGLFVMLAYDGKELTRQQMIAASTRFLFHFFSH